MEFNSLPTKVKRKQLKDKVKQEVRERDNNTCQICYQHGGDLNAHHIRRWIDYPELRYDIDNGITLCVDCHFETYNKENDYIEFLEKRQR